MFSVIEVIEGKAVGIMDILSPVPPGRQKSSCNYRISKTQQLTNDIRSD